MFHKRGKSEMVENAKWLEWLKLNMPAIIDKMAGVSKLTEMAKTTNMAQITKFLKIVDIAGVWKLLIRKFAVIREIAKFTQTKEIT